MCVHGLNVRVIARGTAGGREPVGLFFAIDLVEHLLNGYAPRIHVVVGEQLRAVLVLLAPLATASKRGGRRAVGYRKVA